MGLHVLRWTAVVLACFSRTICGASDCWVAGLTRELCCDLRVSPQGRKDCWSGVYTFEYCCMPKAAVLEEYAYDADACEGCGQPDEIIVFRESRRTGSGKLSQYVPDPDLKELYLSTLRDTLTGTSLKTPSIAVRAEGYTHVPFADHDRIPGTIWCDYCYSMAGTARLSIVRMMLERAFGDDVPGDYVEAGIWRGGTGIFARAVQRANFQGAMRRVIMCDSFRGLPTASTRLDDDAWSRYTYLQVSLNHVRDHFERFQMLDSNVVFVRGFFMTSLPALRRKLQAEGGQIAVLFGDADMFEGYFDILYNLYEFVPVGGYFFCDDCTKSLEGWPVIWQAINRFRDENNITEPIMTIEESGLGAYWRKVRDVAVNYTKYLEWNASRKVKAFYGDTG